MNKQLSEKMAMKNFIWLIFGLIIINAVNSQFACSPDSISPVLGLFIDSLFFSFFLNKICLNRPIRDA
jgi:hypothetical protein